MGIKKKTAETQENKIKYDCKVTRAKDLGEGKPIMFDMIVNGITIYGLSYKTFERKDRSGEFSTIGFPSHKGNDDKYYNWVYFKIDETLLEDIEQQIESLL